MERKEVYDTIIKLLRAGVKLDGAEYGGYKLVDNKEHIKLILEGLDKKSGFCPCRVQKIPENICCCTDFIENGHCCCKIWEKVEK